MIDSSFFNCSASTLVDSYLFIWGHGVLVLAFLSCITSPPLIVEVLIKDELLVAGLFLAAQPLPRLHCYPRLKAMPNLSLFFVLPATFFVVISSIIAVNQLIRSETEVSTMFVENN